MFISMSTYSRIITPWRLLLFFFFQSAFFSFFFLSDMTSSEESGWKYERILLFDVRHVYSSPSADLKYGRYGKTVKKLDFNPLLLPLFHRTVIDPSFYLSPGYSRQNYCVLASLILSIQARAGKSSIRAALKTYKDMDDRIAALSFSGLYDVTKVGMAYKDFARLESLNSRPIPTNLLQFYPALSFFEGLSVNLYRLRHENGSFRLFPLGVSQTSRSSSFFQCDLLLVTSDLLAANTTVPENHVLAVPYLQTLVEKFSKSRGGYKGGICRSCLCCFTSTHALEAHFNVCSIDCRRGSALPRKRSRNMYIHRPFKFNTFSQRVEQNGLQWRRSSNFKMLKPLVTGYFDMESYNIPLSADTGSIYEKIPRGAISTQAVMSYQYVFRSMYKEIPISQSLAAPRIRFSPQTQESGDKELFIGLFLSLRSDLLEHSRHLHNVLSRDVPPPRQSQRDPNLLKYIASKTACDICGKLFGSTGYSHRSKSFYTIIKQFDHDHYYRSMNFPLLMRNGVPMRAVLCQGKYILPSYRILYFAVFSSISFCSFVL